MSHDPERALLTVSPLEENSKNIEKVVVFSYNKDICQSDFRLCEGEGLKMSVM